MTPKSVFKAWKTLTDVSEICKKTYFGYGGLVLG